VQAGRGRAAGVARGEPAEHGAAGDGGAGPDRDRERLVGGAQAARVVNRHDAPARQHAGVDHHPHAGRQHGLARRTGQVHPAVPRPVRIRRRIEPPHHRGPPRQRPPPSPDGGGHEPRARRCERGGAGRRRGQDDRQRQHGKQPVPPGRAQSHGATVRCWGGGGEGECPVCGWSVGVWIEIWRSWAREPYTRCATRHGGSTSRVLLPPVREVAATLGLPAAGARTTATPDTRAAATRSSRQPRTGP
jgi:hypothetical protein